MIRNSFINKGWKLKKHISTLELLLMEWALLKDVHDFTFRDDKYRFEHKLYINVINPKADVTYYTTKEMIAMLINPHIAPAALLGDMLYGRDRNPLNYEPYGETKVPTYFENYDELFEALKLLWDLYPNAPSNWVGKYIPSISMLSDLAKLPPSVYRNLTWDKETPVTPEELQQLIDAGAFLKIQNGELTIKGSPDIRDILITKQVISVTTEHETYTYKGVNKIILSGVFSNAVLCATTSIKLTFNNLHFKGRMILKSNCSIFCLGDNIIDCTELPTHVPVFSVRNGCVISLSGEHLYVRPSLGAPIFGVKGDVGIEVVPDRNIMVDNKLTMFRCSGSRSPRDRGYTITSAVHYTRFKEDTYA